MLPLAELEPLLRQVLAIREALGYENPEPPLEAQPAATTPVSDRGEG